MQMTMSSWGAKKIIGFLLAVFCVLNNFMMMTFATSINAKQGPASVYYANGDITDQAGNVFHSDGSITLSNGSYRDANGAIHYPDGSIRMPNGITYFASGIIQYPNGLQVNANGQIITNENQEESDSDETEGIWDYDPYTNSWKFKILDEHGNMVRIYFNCWIYKKNAQGIKTWYAVDQDGEMIVGWVKYNGEYYYMSQRPTSRGELTTGEMNIGGSSYTFDKETGVMIKGNAPVRNFIVLGEMNYNSKINGSWKRTDDGNKYFVIYKKMENGSRIEEIAKGWTIIDSCYYYFDDAGLPKTGFIEYKHKYYFLERDGRLFEGKVLSLDGKIYEFDKSTNACISIK